MTTRIARVAAAVTICFAVSLSAQTVPSTESTPATRPAEILTPKPGPAPRINGLKVFGVRPNHPFFYHVPVTGDRPIAYSADNLPNGLTLDAATGTITGTLADPGQHLVTLHAKNTAGSADKPFNIVVGDAVALTPPMGWNSWNCWAGAVDQDKVLRSAKAMASSGLIDHGWTYINIDDTWQGTRTPATPHALQANEKFPDMKGLCDQIHALGLKAGIYSTPWVTSYASHGGGSSETEDGTWSKPTGPKHVNHNELPWAIGKYHFSDADAKQWSDWGFDYLKYDWNPIDVPTVAEMHWSLINSGRDIVYSLSNAAAFDHATDYARLANCWRTTGDIRDSWWSLTSIGFSQDKWGPTAGPGHWNDPDMLVVGYVGWGPKLHPSNLTPDEQYTHISLWSLLSAPLLIGCDLDRLDAFTLNLLTNDEVLAIDQDSLGKQARLVSEQGPDITITNNRPNRPPQTKTMKQGQVWLKELEDGSHAVGLFNTGDSDMQITANFADLKLEGQQTPRDLWRQKDLPPVTDKFEATVPPHGVVLIALRPAPVPR